MRFWGSGCFRTYLWPHPPPPSKSSDWVGSTPTKRIYNIVTTTHPPLISLGWKKGVDNLFNLKEPASPWFRPVCKPQLIHFRVNLIYLFFKIAFFFWLYFKCMDKICCATPGLFAGEEPMNQTILTQLLCGTFIHLMGCCTGCCRMGWITLALGFINISVCTI